MTCDSATTVDGFMQRAVARHGDRFDYAHSRFQGFAKPVEIACRRHGCFRTTLKSHLSAKSGGCPGCLKEIVSAALRKTTDSFLRQARELHGDRYDYRLVCYHGCKSKVTIICPAHGAFEMRPSRHLEGRGCRQCAFQRFGVERRLSFWSFVERALEVHGTDQYEYQLADFENAHSLIPIRCCNHGVFRQTVNSHLGGAGCPRCVQSAGEQRVRQVLSALGVAFREQVRFDACRDKRPLPFDFLVSGRRLLIEYDGRQHVENSELWGGDAKLAETKRHDAIKTAFARQHGYRLLRISHDQFEQVSDIVLDALIAAAEL